MKIGYNSRVEIKSLLRRIKRILEKLLRLTKRDSRISVDPSSVLLPSVRFDFRMRGGSIRVGKNSVLGCNFIFESDQGKIEIGSRTYIGGGTNLISREKIVIGDDVTIAWGVYLYDHNSHSVDWEERRKDITRIMSAYHEGKYLSYNKDWSPVKSVPIFVGDKAWIGFDAVIMKGVTIGEGAIVGARAVVTRNVAPWTIVGGNPAVKIGDVPRK